MKAASSQDYLHKRKFGKTDLLVTPICIGTAALGSTPKSYGFSVEQDIALKTLHEAFKSKINFIDTSSNYGKSEQRIGNALDAIQGLPSGYVLQTKADRDMVTGDFSGDQVKISIEGSLKKLGLSKLQIVYLHDPEHTTFDEAMAKNGPVEVLHKYKEQGIVDHIGVAGGPIDLLIRYINTDAFEAVITHNRYNLLYRTANPLIDLAVKKGLAIINAAPFGSGIFAKGLAYPRFAYRNASYDLIERVQAMENICLKYNVSLKKAALHFSLKDSRITSTIVGMTKPEQIKDIISLSEDEMPNEIWEELNAYALYEGDPETNQ